MTDALALLLVPFLAALVLTGIHTYLGIHVLTRNIIFVDLAIAQISALGATVAFMLGYPPQSLAAYGYSLAFTGIAAVVLTLSRGWSTRISQETFIGIIYVMAAAGAFLLVDRAPQGAEHVKQILIGTILTVTQRDVVNLVGLYAFIGGFHWLFRRRFLLITRDPVSARRDGMRLWWWDLLFYASFGVVVTSSVAVAGVLLVFSFLIIPAVIGTLYYSTTLGRLLAGWLAGTVASALGLVASYTWNLPTGATMVCAFGVVLVLAAALRPLMQGSAAARHTYRRAATASAWTALAVVLLLSGAWLMIYPRADQPLLDLLEGWQPNVRTAFLTASERETVRDAEREAAQVAEAARRLSELEHRSRYSGREISDEELRRLSSYVQSYQEMQKGEQFVQRELRNRARHRQRWWFGLPMIATAVVLFAVARRTAGSLGRANKDRAW